MPCAREDDLAAVLEGLFAKLPARDEASASCAGTDAAGDESGEGASAQADAGTGSEGLAGAAGVQLSLIHIFLWERTKQRPMVIVNLLEV